MRRYRLAPSFLRDFGALEGGLSSTDAEILDKLLAAILSNPLGLRRAQSFYDPHRPSYLTRSDPFVIQYAHDQDIDEVIFLNVFRRH